MSTPFRLVAGDPAPVQRSSTTCGAACLTVARMLIDAPFARWITAGEGPPVLGAEGSRPEDRFAAWERTVHRRTNGWRRPGGGVGPAWPRALGTPPWGARHELEHGASRPGTTYDTHLLRLSGAAALARVHDRLLDLVAPGEPALLYVGDALLPRHVTLLLPSGARHLDVYDPGSGQVGRLERDALAQQRLGLSGWDHPWAVVQPSSHRVERIAQTRWGLGEQPTAAASPG